MLVQPLRVMAGLVPAIHAAPLQETFEVRTAGWAWMPGARPGMTCADVEVLPRRANFFAVGE
jgi:hypothetical protein